MSGLVIVDTGPDIRTHGAEEIREFTGADSLAYLSLFGSALAFGAYLTLMRRIGADRASYTAVAIPVVALLLSTAFEQFRWQLQTFLGVALCLGGNLLMLRRRRA